MKYALLFLLIPLATGIGQETETENLQLMIAEAFANNPEIAGQVFRMQVYENKIPQAGALDDPEVRLKWMEIPGTQFNQAMYANLELMQMIRYPGKLGLARDIARIQAEHAHHDHLEVVLDVISRLKSAYAMLWYAREALRLNREDQQFLRQVLDAAATQYALGKTTQQDVLKTNVELAKLEVEEEAFQREAMAAESMLRSLLNRKPSESIGPLEPLTLVAIPFSEQRLVSFALSNRPMIIHDSLSVTESALMVQMQRQEYVPDLRLSLEYVTLPTLGHKRWSVMAGVTIPFAPWTLRKASARVEEATAERWMRQSMYTASRRMVEAQIIENFARLKAAETRVRAYQTTIIPQVEQSLKISMTEYQTGRASYLMLLDSFRMYQMRRMEAAMALMQFHQQRAALERAVGVTDLVIVPQEDHQ